jgi:ribosome-binding protein aMBF1 (putative translation factor)
MPSGTLTIEGAEYVVLPKAEYLRLLHGEPRNEALEYGLLSLGRDLKAARAHAGMTQAELAKKLKKSQATVSGSESGTIRISEKYIAKVLKVCGLPADWKAPPRGERLSKVPRVR